jgi:hypothetical protein
MADNKSGDLWQLSFDKADPLNAIGTTLCHCDGLPTGVAAISDMKVAVIVGRSLCIWTYLASDGYKGALSIVIQSVGVMPCGLYSLPVGVATSKTSSSALYVLDQERHSITEVWKVGDRAWQSKVVMGGIEGVSASTTMGTASAIALCKPTFGCFVHKAFVFADSGCQCIRMLTDAFAHAEVLIPMLRTFAEAFQLMEPSFQSDEDSSDGESDGDAYQDNAVNDDADGENMHHNATNLLQTAAKLHIFHIFLSETSQAIAQETGNSIASLQGPLGHFSRSVRCAVRAALVALPRLVSGLLLKVGCVSASFSLPPFLPPSVRSVHPSVPLPLRFSVRLFV